MAKAWLITETSSGTALVLSINSEQTEFGNLLDMPNDELMQGMDLVMCDDELRSTA